MVYAGPPRWRSRPADNGVFILWDGREDAILQDAPSALGPWNDVGSGCHQPVLRDPVAPSRFYGRLP